MSDLVVITFDNESTAFEMRTALAKMQKDYLIDREDVVCIKPCRINCKREMGR